MRSPKDRENPHVSGATIRVALVVPALSEGGGVPTVARFLYRTLKATNRYDPFFISLAMSSRDETSVRMMEPSTWIKGVRIQESQWREWTYPHVGAWWSEIEFMRYAPRRPLTERLEKADLVQVVAGTPCWVLPTLRTSVPVMLQVATLTGRERRRRQRSEEGIAALWRRVMTAATKRLDQVGLRSADRIFVENRWMEERASAEAGPDRVVFAPPGVDVDRFRPRDRPGQADKPEKPYILSVGRFDDPRKDTELLFQAYAHLKTRKPTAPELWLAGISGPSPEAWKIAQDNGVEDEIRYVGKVSDRELTQLYRNAVFFVLSSDQEGFGLVIVEAMASGIPVVSTECDGPGDIITEGENGILVPKGNAEALAVAMGRLVGSAGLRRRMGQRARRAAVETYSLSVAGQRFLKEYDVVLQNDSVSTES